MNNAANNAAQIIINEAINAVASHYGASPAEFEMAASGQLGIDVQAKVASDVADLIAAGIDEVRRIAA